MDLLVATDFSPHGKTVLRVARRLGQALGARTWVIHVAAPAARRAAHGGRGPRGVAAVADDVREEQRLVEEAASALRESGLEATGLLVEGPPVRTLLEEAARLEVDMIVIGSHGYGAVARALLGSVSAGVVRHATCPVLVVPVRRQDA